MENFYIQYLFKILISSAIFYLVYAVFLKKDTCFTLKRICLILATIIPIVYPFISFSMSSQSVENNITLQAIVVTNQNLQNYLTGNTEIFSQYHLKDYIMGVWAIGIVVALLLLILKLYNISKLYKSSNIVRQYKIGKCNVYETVGVDSFSFFNTIFIGNNVKTNQQEILQHELLHVRYGHSLELICFEMVTILFWWNPINWFLKQEVRINHEYMVDQKMITKGVDKKGYQYMLLHTSLQNSSISIINYFNVSQLKKRISMMNKQRTTKIGYAKYLMMIMIPMMLFVANSKTLTAKEVLTLETIMPEIVSTQIDVVLQDRKVYDFVEVMPKFPGGDEGMMKYIGENLVYPIEAVEEGKQGRVTVKFIVTETGTIEDVKVSRVIDSRLDQLAIDVVKKMPKWTPGQQDGKDVAVNFTLPIVFKLPDPEKK